MPTTATDSKISNHFFEVTKNRYLRQRREARTKASLRTPLRSSLSRPRFQNSTKPSSHSLAQPLSTAHPQAGNPLSDSILSITKITMAPFRSSSWWFATDININNFTYDEADQLELKFADLETNGIIDKHSGHPKLEDNIIRPAEKNKVWKLTNDAVYRYRYESDDDKDSGPDDDIDPLVWQCRERNGELTHVEIRKLSQLPPSYRQGLSEEDLERIVAMSLDRRSTMVFPAPATKTKRPNKGKKRAAEEREDEKIRDPWPAVKPARSSQREADDQDTQALESPKKRASYYYYIDLSTGLEVHPEEEPTQAQEAPKRRARTKYVPHSGESDAQADEEDVEEPPRSRLRFSENDFVVPSRHVGRLEEEVDEDDDTMMSGGNNAVAPGQTPATIDRRASSATPERL